MASKRSRLGEQKWRRPRVSIVVRADDKAQNVILTFSVTLTSQHFAVSEVYQYLSGGEIFNNDLCRFVRDAPPGSPKWEPFCPVIFGSV